MDGDNDIATLGAALRDRLDRGALKGRRLPPDEDGLGLLDADVAARIVLADAEHLAQLVKLGRPPAFQRWAGVIAQLRRLLIA
jgi:hypothetical protein